MNLYSGESHSRRRSFDGGDVVQPEKWVGPGHKARTDGMDENDKR